jgi:putative ABC transport system permease protein
MSLFQIAVRNLSRRKGKMAFMLIGLILGSATVIAIYSTVTSMQREISQQLSDLGANIVITAGSGELTFQYGGITIPELVFDAAALTEADLDSVRSIPGSKALLAAAPKLIGTASAGGRNVVIAGTDLPAEFAVKPWLRFSGDPEKIGPGEETPSGSMEMDNDISYSLLNLERASNIPDLASDQVVIGSVIADLLAVAHGDTIVLAGYDFEVLAVLEETGMAEDSQILMNMKTAQLVMGRSGELTVIEIASDFSLIAEEALLSQLGEALPHASITGVRQAVMGRDELLTSLSRFGILAGGLVFLTGVLIVFLTMSAAVRERTREIGILRAIGFRSRHIFTVIATEGLLVSAIGGIAGYHSGLIAAGLAGPILTGSNLNNPWQIPVLLLTTAVTTAVGGAAGFLPALKAARLDPAEALRYI